MPPGSHESEWVPRPTYDVTLKAGVLPGGDSGGADR